MSYNSATINITRDVPNINGIYDYSYLRDAIKEALEDNFYAILNRQGIDTISTLNASSASDILINVSMDDNVVFINKVMNNNITEIATINYVPYISYIKYAEYMSNTSGLPEQINKYRQVATVLLNIIIDRNIVGFSILSPSDLQLVDAENNIYVVNNNVNQNSYTEEAVSENGYDATTFPDIIKLQSTLINDVNSYYEIDYSDINTPYSSIKVPCINGNVYYNNNIYSFTSLFNNLYMNFIENSDETVINNVVMNPKLMCVSVENEDNTITTTNAVQAFSNTIYDCPSLNASEYWNSDNELNIGDSITINDSEYVISNNNTLIQLANTEIYGINQTIIYDGNPHFISLVYPNNATAEYRLKGTEEFLPLPTDISEITEYVDANTYEFEYKVTVPINNDTKEYYGDVTLTILPATQYGNLAVSYTGPYDALPHTVYIYTDGTVEFSLNEIDWTTTAPTFIDVGTYKVYYRIIKNNYITYLDNIDVVIYVSDDEEALDFGIDISKNIIVMREQLYSGISSNLFILPTNNKVYLSTNNPEYINVNDFTGSFPNPRYPGGEDITIPSTTELGRFKLSPNDYYIMLECFLPWYADNTEPSVNNKTNFNNMLGNTVEFSIQYTNETNITSSTEWITLVDNISPSNAFYLYRVTNISAPTIDGEDIGTLWGDASGNQPSVKRALAYLPLNYKSAGTAIKTVRIMCTHTGQVIMPTPQRFDYVSKISSNNLGVSLITLTEYSTPSAIKYNNQSITYNNTTNIYQQIPIKFKSALTSNAFFYYNTGNNLQYSGCCELNYATFTDSETSITWEGIDETTGLYDKQAYVLWRNGSSSEGNEAGNWLRGNAFIIIKDELTRIQFNTYDMGNRPNSIVDNKNTDKIYAYLNCNEVTT